MKNIYIASLLAMMSILPLGVQAQDIQITKFERNYTSLIGSMNPVYDNAGEACAVIRFFVRNKDFVIEPNLGVKKRVDNLPGEIRLWVPRGTKRITVRSKNMIPLMGFEIPERIESKVTYDAVIELSEAAINRIQKTNGGHNVYLGVGYNMMSLSGPSLAIGANVNHHQIELGATYGLNKTDDLYFYDSSGNVNGGYHYLAIRVNLSYGYEIAVSDFFLITPMIGGTYLAYMGKDLGSGIVNINYKDANSISGIGALRFTVSLINSFRLCLTPEYDLGLYKDNTCKLVSNNDDKMKKWHTGLNLNVGMMIFF